MVSIPFLYHVIRHYQLKQRFRCHCSSKDEPTLLSPGWEHFEMVLLPLEANVPRNLTGYMKKGQCLHPPVKKQSSSYLQLPGTSPLIRFFGCVLKSLNPWSLPSQMEFAVAVGREELRAFNLNTTSKSHWPRKVKKAFEFPDSKRIKDE